MLIVAGYFRVPAGDRVAFLENRRASVVRSRGERGCHAYTISADLVDPELVQLYERWESKEDLAAHVAANRADPRPPDGFDVLESEVLQYEIASVGALGS
ncbi:MAG TPA: antibiotic biosynthesis monooxygenase family protein [Streptosporangiaceae bacterium]|nr:antibiotic biosynthesis monooxygenase family protein [Streptosporangiaceae bacterium]